MPVGVGPATHMILLPKGTVRCNLTPASRELIVPPTLTTKSSQKRCLLELFSSVVAPRPRVSPEGCLSHSDYAPLFTCTALPCRNPSDDGG